MGSERLSQETDPTSDIVWMDSWGSTSLFFPTSGRFYLTSKFTPVWNNWSASEIIEWKARVAALVYQGFWMPTTMQELPVASNLEARVRALEEKVAMLQDAAVKPTERKPDEPAFKDPQQQPCREKPPFEFKTELARQLWELRQENIMAGTRLMSPDEINEEVAKRRGQRPWPDAD